ncbi:hypothetical protein [Actinacidiphila glaucinigra]|uniref:Small hydrophobic protein n=1 Tax=Actinacidiphila glaucinigra TaxID=235986 RepID=A0A239CPT1_9ACTN|nr:hypothetical protein [Actinacidiphila glaucinigra]SNS21778.1 hypothetical protein SAMN05216252_104135 [Actinacidiphila glaucinigra]
MSHNSRTRTGASPRTLGAVGLLCAVAGFFVLGIVLGPAAVVCGRLAMGRTPRGTRPVLPLVAVVLGAIDTVIALVWLTGAHWDGGGMM